MNKEGMSQLNVQYSSRAWLAAVYRCKSCGLDLLMFGCDNPDCENYYKNNIKQANSQPLNGGKSLKL